MIVEIFPQQKEFAVRTFGLPGADGLLGVCFGRVITANSPASQGEQPVELGGRALARVLPCGHPEQDAQQDAPLAERGDLGLRGGAARIPPGATPLNPQFRAMILGDELTPLEPAQLGVPGAQDVAPPAVRLLRVGPGGGFPGRRRFGLPALKGVLDDLGAGDADQRGPAASDQNDARSIG